MAEEVVKTIENIDKMFAQIEVNGQVYNSNRFSESSSSLGSSRSTTAQQTQGEDVEAVVLNNTKHDFRDGEALEAVEQLQEGLNTEVSTRQQNVNDLTAEVTALQQLLSTIQSRINEINVLIPSQASASNQLADSDSVSSAISSATSPLSSAVTGIEAKIPNQASAQNQLADKDFVNSSIATNTANFLGTYTSMAQIEAIPNPTNNDYAFLKQTISAGNTVYKRYKYSASTSEWLFEYDLNNSSFTAEQWATINSGLTQSSVSSAISTAVSAEATARANAVSAEATARANAVSAEATARANAVSAEATARANADNQLTNDISEVDTLAQSADTKATSALSTAQGAQSTANSASSIASSASSTAQLALKKCARVNYSDLGFTSSSPSNIEFATFITRIASYLGVSKDVVMIQPVNNISKPIDIVLDNGKSYSLDSIIYIGNIIDDYTFVFGKTKETTGILLGLSNQDSWIILQDSGGQLAKKIALTT